jgi:hypothetical protein
MKARMEMLHINRLRRLYPDVIWLGNYQERTAD